MSIAWLTVFVPLVGLVAFGLLERLVTAVRVAATCVVMISSAGFILFVQNMETIPRPWNFYGAWHWSIFSVDRTVNVPNPAPGSAPGLNFALQAISKEDHIFLDQLLRKLEEDAQPQGKSVSLQVQNIRRAGVVGSGDESLLKTELAINTAEVKRAEPVNRKETVKRGQLVRPGRQ
jgi:hypothetical protein